MWCENTTYNVNTTAFNSIKRKQATNKWIGFMTISFGFEFLFSAKSSIIEIWSYIYINVSLRNELIRQSCTLKLHETYCSTLFWLHQSLIIWIIEQIFLKYISWAKNIIYVFYGCWCAVCFAVKWTTQSMYLWYSLRAIAIPFNIHLSRLPFAISHFRGYQIDKILLLAYRSFSCECFQFFFLHGIFS